MSSVVVVTLSFNNVEETRKTLASVALQRVGPSRYLVVDSSGPAQAKEIKKLSALANAEYHWVAPQGVYPAMNHALSLLADGDYVWFINSSDWLAGPESVAEMHSALDEGVQWVVGGLSRLGDTRNPFHPQPREPEIFIEHLEKGLIGFPHPSTVMSVKTIREIGGFNTRFRIAADYDLALRFGSVAVHPILVDSVVAVHVPTGLTSRFKFLHFVEKGKARREVLGTRQLVMREWKILWRLFRAQLRGKVSNTGVVSVPRSLDSFDASIDTWPRIGN